MNLFERTYFNATASALVSRGISADHVCVRACGLPQPPAYDPVESDDDLALARLTDEIRDDLLLELRHDDLLPELRHESLAEIITQKHELHETDLYSKLLTAYSMWDGRAETAYERMKVIDRLIYKAMDKIAEKEARRVLDL